jgi:hypothetical protein
VTQTTPDIWCLGLCQSNLLWADFASREKFDLQKPKGTMSGVVWITEICILQAVNKCIYCKGERITVKNTYNLEISDDL